MKPRISILGIPMHPWTMQETVTEIDNRLRDGKFTQHGVVNVAKIVNMRENPDLYNAVVACDIINIDGVIAGTALDESSGRA